MPKYLVQFKTSNEEGSGTNAFIGLRLFGKNGYVSREYGDFNSKKDDFERNQLDTFELPEDTPSDEICALHVRIDYDDSHGHGDNAWKLDYINLIRKTDDQSFQFPCNRYLSKERKRDHSPGWTLYVERLSPEERMEVNKLVSNHYGENTPQVY